MTKTKLATALSIKLRLSRGKFWLYCLVLWALLYVFIAITAGLSGLVVGLMNVPFLIAFVIFCVRRLHDRNYVGWWLLMAAIPVLGAVWLFWQLACRSGTPEINRWGNDPRVNAADYLVVQS